MITAFQHVGMGVYDVDRTYSFYRKLLGFKVKLNDHTAYDEAMEPIIGERVEMRLLMAMNVGGGGAIELCQHTSTAPREPLRTPEWGDIGILEVGLKAFHLDRVCESLRARGVEFLTTVQEMEMSGGGKTRYAYLRDPDGLLLQLVEEQGGGYPRVGGVTHVAIGVRDLDRARGFYSRALGFDRLLHESAGFPGPDEVTQGKETRMVILGQTVKGESSLPLIEAGAVKLVQTPSYAGQEIYAGRRWADIGCMEFALDVNDLERTFEDLLAAGAEHYHPPTRIDMGSGSIGSFAYVKDPDGNIVELVDVEKVMFVPPTVMKNVLVWPLKAAARMRLL